ncbi:thiamine pyrophosphate-dependent dehydrogenase E1 component subunit alpha [Spongiactinospora sp. TRM90649]|uniref:thiamine pyrophosphate-dependent dehydrogenase E1 component subunit alpha n=1 Tax=Spongiactinospora sp. TRM90649 TaxID=3031114 RepID=UPI0023F95200|nr:thiamine pyrophosphate-dependent dehydrogenase E1 component subunit alpha [Spongiactinospora sp. TRM90649]MDF5758072.1 thiamine pyrophosphate-dependent dehydrogenase E1 component subunit alpha [Spongiactinospora sp. TRM90649]
MSHIESPPATPAVPFTGLPIGAAEQDEAHDFYRRMSIVRAVELEIEKMHRLGRMSGSFHSSMGQEAAAVGVCAALRPADLVTSTHRGHGHALAKGVPIEGVFAELFGRASGVSGGRGGSMHLHHRPSGFLGENAIVAGGVPWAAGAAWARRRQGTDDIGVAFIGDGGFAQGVTHETLLISRFWNSPCLIVCENNGLAHSMPSERLFGPPGSIARMVEATGVRSLHVDGRDVMAVAEAARELVAEVRRGVPAFLECSVFRVRPHSLSDPDYRYRPRRAGQDWLALNDPIANLRARLAPLPANRLARIDAEVAEEIAGALERAEAASRPPASAATSFVYSSPELQNHA